MRRTYLSYHFAGVLGFRFMGGQWDGGADPGRDGMALYRNGVQAATTSAGSGPAAPDGGAVYAAARVGAAAGGGGPFFKGAVRDVRVYARAVYPGEVAGMVAGLAPEHKWFTPEESGGDCTAGAAMGATGDRGSPGGVAVTQKSGATTVGEDGTLVLGAAVHPL